MTTFSFDTYLSPFSWRYGSEPMRLIWSEKNKRLQMRRTWIALATAQHRAGLVTAEQLADLEAHADQIDIPRALEIEAEVKHDVMAEIKTYAEQCPIGGGIIHWGATSADINDNVYALRIKASLKHLRAQLGDLLAELVDQIERYADLPIMAHTHIQPAEPTTLGYRLAVYAQDLWLIGTELDQLISTVRGKGFKGAVGTQAGYADILAGSGMTAQEMEAAAMTVLDLPYFLIATQTYTRQQDLRILQLISALAASMHKWALDFRVLQSPPFGEWAESFGKRQVGSSAMPFKRNPINSENICSIARYVAALPGVAWDNASQAILERSLDDSANRRLVLPEGFLAADELLRRMTRVVKSMTYDSDRMAQNLATYGPFAATERVMMAIVAGGGDRQAAHEWLRECSLTAWSEIQAGQPNRLGELVAADERILQYLSTEEAPYSDGGR